MATQRIYAKSSDIPVKIPIFPLSNVILLPHGELPLNIFEPRYLAMVNSALQTNRLIGMIQPNVTNIHSNQEFETVGCVGRITSFQETHDGRYLIGLTGICRFELLNSNSTDEPYVIGEVSYEAYERDIFEHPTEYENFNTDPLYNSLKAFFEIQDLDTDWNALRAAPVETIMSAMIMILPLTPSEKQALIQTQNFSDQVELFVALTERLVARTHGGKTSILQ